MSMSLDPSAGGNTRNALFLARACELAYLAEAEGTPRFRSELGLEAQADQRGQHAGLCRRERSSDGCRVSRFGGPDTLDGLKDWLLTNANNYLILPEGQSGTEFAAAGVGARFHGVFWMHLP